MLCRKVFKHQVQVIPKPFSKLFKIKFMSSTLLKNGSGLKAAAKQEEMLQLKKLYEEESTKKDRMIIGFTCKVCNARSYKAMGKKSYNEGVVIIKCESCKNLHLMADHLGWFDSMKNIGTIEDILREKGESIQKLEYSPEDAKKLYSIKE